MVNGGLSGDNKCGNGEGKECSDAQSDVWSTVHVSPEMGVR